MLELQKITKVYNPGEITEVCVFRDFSLTVGDGEFVSVVGSNGSGKTSMLNIVCGSIREKEGLDQLAYLIETELGGQTLCDGSILTNARQYDACRRAYEAMLRALQGLKLGQTPDAVLLDVEEAMEAMGEVTGATVREDITARIFERFCVGK